MVPEYKDEKQQCVERKTFCGTRVLQHLNQDIALSPNNSTRGGLIESRSFLRASGIMRFLFLFFFSSKLCAKNRELCELRNIFKRKVFMFQFTKLALVSLLIQKLSIFKAKTRGKKMFYRQINRSRALFLSQAVIGYISSNHGACHIKKLVHRPQRPVGWNAWNSLMICERFLQRSGGCFLRKCTIFTGKEFPCISQGMKKDSC